MPDETEKKLHLTDADSATDESLVQSKIGKKLKTLYDGVVEEEIPDRFLELLDKLDKSEPNGE